MAQTEGQSQPWHRASFGLVLRARGTSFGEECIELVIFKVDYKRLKGRLESLVLQSHASFDLPLK